MSSVSSELITIKLINKEIPKMLMSEESDLVKEFSNFFEEEDKKKEKEEMALFVKTFKTYFDEIKKKKFNDGNAIVNFVDWARSAIYNANNSNNPKEKTIQFLGKGLGTFLALFEYIIPNPKYNDMVSRGDVIEKIDGRVDDMAKELKSIGKTVKLKFIKNRLQKVARRYAGKLNPRMQAFLSQTAAKFA